MLHLNLAILHSFFICYFVLNVILRLFQTDTETVFDFGKICFLIADDVIGHTQFRIVLNVWSSKVS